MGDIVDFIFGSKSKEKSSSSSSSQSTSGNQAYNSLSQALGPTLGYSSGAGSMMASLLGIPTPGNGILGMGGGSPTGEYAYNYNPTSGQAAGTGTPIGSGGAFGRVFGGSAGNRDGARFEVDSPYDRDKDSSNYSSAYSPAYTNPIDQRQPIASSTTPQAAGSGLENFANSAGMQFIRDQGIKSIEGSQAGKGMLQSGATGKALSTFGTNLGKTYLNDYLNHLMDYAGIGSKNAAILGSTGGVSQSTGLSSGSGSSTGGKNGLLNNLIAAF